MTDEHAAYWGRLTRIRKAIDLEPVDRLGGDFDGINALPAGRITATLSVAWLSRVAVPARDLADDGLWQVVESEVMTAADYDTIIEQGWPAFLAGYLPRVSDMAELAAEGAWLQTNRPAIVQRFRERGYVPVSCGGTTIPFECLGGGRSLEEFYLDLPTPSPRTCRPSSRPAWSLEIPASPNWSLS